MKDDASEGPLEENPTRMILFALNQQYWLAEGDEFLTPMLKGSGYFPIPIICIIFQGPNELREFLGHEYKVTDFWGINPDIVDRLRRDKHLKEVNAQDL